ncbi:TrkH family potassium uptake protein [Hippea maritima]|uniref:Potassium uptake protein, TrkH family n=1 Tax=Hippea maritima (strain ATCC 700847 / DSM 10411 / MH2) TaxID=760142 RepID=F2LTJ4_HIPMA|nr:TrkH family potassium uptake protein [Hippea maritima]AEA33319.1 potassium uptake protein, TrkH family [Hippea maritima DSM 10411]
MKLKLIGRFISILLIITTLFLCVPLVFSIYYKDGASLGFLITITLNASFGSAGLLLTKNPPKSLSRKEGFILVVLSWVVISVFGSIPYVIIGNLSFTDAFFETMSGFTTTGASILKNIEAMPKSLLFWRSLTHWLGGMGIVVLAVAILPMLGIGGIKLIKAEAPGPSIEKISPRITETAKYLWFAYILLSAFETVLLLVGGMDLFDALTHTFGTMATGGFSPKNSSVAYFHSAYIDWVITIFMFIAGANFSIHFKVLTGKFSSLKDEEFLAYSAIVIIAVLLVSLDNLAIYKDFLNSLRFSAFQVVSIVTTTGYATADYEKWHSLSKVILFTFMFVGGCAGSTGGSIKVIRIYTLLKQAVNELKYNIHPKGVFTLTINKQTIRKNIVYSIAGFFFLYIATFFVVALVVSAFGVDLLTSLSASAATLGNIGPGFGGVGPTDNYAWLPSPAKWVLSFAMLSGRLEIYTVFVLFTPAFWKK